MGIRHFSLSPALLGAIALAGGNNYLDTPVPHFILYLRIKAF